MIKNKSENLIKSSQYYTLEELAELLQVHIRTVQNWLKMGLELVDESTRPYLLDGRDVKRFLQEQRKRKKVKLRKTEFYCPKCHRATPSAPDDIKFITTGKLLGGIIQQVIIYGKCIVCYSKMVRFSTQNEINEYWK